MGAAGVAAVLAAIPLLYIAVRTGSAGLEAVATVLARPRLPALLINTIALVAGVTCAATVLGVATAFILARVRLRWTGALAAVSMLPLAVPSYLAAFGWLAALPRIHGHALRHVAGHRCPAGNAARVRRGGPDPGVLAVANLPQRHVARDPQCGAGRLPARQSLCAGGLRRGCPVSLPRADHGHPTGLRRDLRSHLCAGTELPARRDRAGSARPGTARPAPTGVRPRP